MKKNKTTDSTLIAHLAIEGMQEKKGHDIVKIDLRKLQSSVAEYFIICHGDSDKQVEAIADSVEEFVYKNSGERPYSREGERNAEWLLIDYVDVVVHVFIKEKRNVYGIETLWGDGEITAFEDQY